MTAPGYQRNRGKPGELPLIIGLSCMVIAPFVLAIVHSEGKELQELKTAGVVSAASVVAHDQREVQGDGRRGRDRSTTSYLVEVRYDPLAATRYADWKSGQAPVQKYAGVTSTQQFELSKPDRDTVPVGAKTTVLFMPGNPARMDLVTTVERETSASYFLKYYLAMAALMLGGLGLALWGWRTRRAAG